GVGPRSRMSGDPTALRLERTKLVGPASVCRGLYVGQRGTMANHQRVRVLLLLPFDGEGSRTGKDDALVLRHLTPALALHALPATKGNHPSGRRYAGSITTPESPAGGVGSGQIVCRDPPYLEHTKQESRSVFRCGDGAVLWGHVPRLEEDQQDARREDREDVEDEDRGYHPGRSRLRIAVQHVPHVLSSGDLFVLARDLAGE